jgi:hypothetical protein
MRHRVDRFDIGKSLLAAPMRPRTIWGAATADKGMRARFGDRLA